ncbi:MAG TPA: STAS domain-containing protein [Planctomycetota bacterium]|nr:STAS domain-containing protein [Planctomycetota bacterium]
MEFTREEKSGLTLVHLTGEVDMRSSPTLRKELREVSDTKVPRVAVDLRNVTYIDSSGIATLIELLKHVAHYGGKLLLVGVNDDIYPVFELAHLTDVFELRRDLSTD